MGKIVVKFCQPKVWEAIDEGEPIMFEGIGDDELGDGDFWESLDRDELARGCATTDPSLWLMLMAIAFVIGWNLRRTKKVK